MNFGINFSNPIDSSNVFKSKKEFDLERAYRKVEVSTPETPEFLYLRTGFNPIDDYIQLLLVLGGITFGIKRGLKNL